MAMSGFAAGLLAGQQAAMNGINVYRQSQQQQEREALKQDLKDISAATPEHAQGFTSEQGSELQKLADQGYEIGFDQGKNAYTATKDGAAPQTVAMQGVTDFMGQRQAGTLSADQVRSGAIADAFTKYDPERGLMMRNQLRRDAREDQRFGREQKQWAREDDLAAIDKELGDKFQTSLVGADGQQRVPTAQDFVGASQLRAYRLAQAGHTKEAQQAFKDAISNAHIQLQLDTEEREKASGEAFAAARSGDFAPLAKFYNRFIPSGMQVTGIEQGKDGTITIQGVGMDGKPVTAARLKNMDELAYLLKSVKDPTALYQYSQGEFQRQLQLNQDRRAGNADARAASAEGRAAATHAQAQGDRRALMDIRGALANEAGMNPTQIEAVRRGVLEVPGRADSKVKYDYDPVKIQKAFGETSADPITGKETVKRNSAEETKFMEFMADNPSIKDVDQGLMLYNQARVQRERKAVSQQDATRAKVLQNITPEKLAATAKKYNMTVDQVRAELEKSGIAVK